MYTCVCRYVELRVIIILYVVYVCMYFCQVCIYVMYVFSYMGCKLVGSPVGVESPCDNNYVAPLRLDDTRKPINGRNIHC
jgi:hypothetical protein